MPTFKSGDLDGLEKWLNDKLSDGLKRGVVSAAFRTLGVIQNVIIPGEQPQPVDTGAYRAGWRVETTERGADIFNDLPEAPIIEWGARAENIKVGRALIEALAEWAKRKGFAPDHIPKGGGDRAYESIAWAIATAMRKRGIFNRNGQSGLRVAEKAVKRLKEYVHEEVAREMKR
jgi:hypothetical protein